MSHGQEPDQCDGATYSWARWPMSKCLRGLGSSPRGLPDVIINCSGREKR